jgi:phenylacetic acid degradation operon negative regulatory protein
MTSHRTLAGCADELLRRFGRQRPLRAGSLIVTLFGDAIAARGSEVALAALIGLLAPFGITARLARTSIGRLAQEGWLRARRSGRASFYRLTDSGEARFAQATARIYAAPPRDWHREWTLVVLPNTLTAPSRETTRKELAWMGFGQWSQCTFAHAEMSAAETQRHLHRLKLKSEAIVLTTRSSGVEADRRLVALGWDLRALARRYRRFVHTFEPALHALRAGDDIAARDGFHLRTLLIHEYRRVHLRDPLLPSLLLPTDWAGAGAYALCRTLYLRLASRSDAYLAAELRGPDGELPIPAPAYFQRFAPQIQSAPTRRK